MRYADSAEMNKQGFQWVDVVAGKKKNNMATNNKSVEIEQAQQIPDLQTKIMANLEADSNDRDMRSKNLIIFGLDFSKQIEKHRRKMKRT